MKIVVVHNFYQQRGGEDVVVEHECALLRDHGHDVIELFVGNDNIVTTVEKFRAAMRVSSNPKAKREITGVLETYKPDVVHVHNTFPSLSPSVFFACQRMGVPCILTLHNFRLTCAAATLLREGSICEKCIGGSPYWGAVHRCYRNSLFGSAAVAHMIAMHRRMRTWHEQVDYFLALTEFAKRKFISAGLPGDRILVKGNSVADRFADVPITERKGALYVGRLSEEKGVRQLISAWSDVNHPLVVVGDGPLMQALVQTAPPHVTFTGTLSKEKVLERMRASELLIMPSIWYEGFPATLLEAMASQLPALVSKIGSLEEIVLHGVTGAHTPPGDTCALARSANAILGSNSKLVAMGLAARNEFESKYSPEVNASRLIEIYQAAKQRKKMKVI